MRHLKSGGAVFAMMCVGAVSAQQPLLQTYSGTMGTMTKDPQGVAASLAQAPALVWRNRGVGIDGTWRTPWDVAQLAVNGQDPASLGSPAVASVSLATGDYSPTEVDLSLPCIGPSWTIGRTRRGLGGADGGIHGRGWSQSSQPQIVFWDRTGSADDVVYLVYGGDRFAEFRRVMNGSSSTNTFRGVNGAAGAFTNNARSPLGASPLIGGVPVLTIWTYHDPRGVTIDFFGAGSSVTDTSSVVHDGSWQVWRITNAEGSTAYVGNPTDGIQALIAGYDAGGRITNAYDSAGRHYAYSYGGTTSRLTGVTATTGASTVATVTSPITGAAGGTEPRTNSHSSPPASRARAGTCCTAPTTGTGAPRPIPRPGSARARRARCGSGSDPRARVGRPVVTAPFHP